MGLLNNIKDHFTNAEFTVAPNKKVKTVCADPELTLAALNKKTTKDVKTKETEELKIKASMKVGEAEKLFDKLFGLTVQIKDPKGTFCVDNKLTIGQAARGESK